MIEQSLLLTDVGFKMAESNVSVGLSKRTLRHHEERVILQLYKAQQNKTLPSLNTVFRQAKAIS